MICCCVVLPDHGIRDLRRMYPLPVTARSTLRSLRLHSVGSALRAVETESTAPLGRQHPLPSTSRLPGTARTVTSLVHAEVTTTTVWLDLPSCERHGAVTSPPAPHGANNNNSSSRLPDSPVARAVEVPSSRVSSSNAQDSDAWEWEYYDDPPAADGVNGPVQRVETPSSQELGSSLLSMPISDAEFEWVDDRNA